MLVNQLFKVLKNVELSSKIPFFIESYNLKGVVLKVDKTFC